MRFQRTYKGVLIKILMKFVLTGPVNNKAASVQMMTRHQRGDKSFLAMIN